MLENKNIFDKLKSLNCEIQVEALEESCFSLDDAFPEISEEDLKEISQRLQRGDVWAFCTVVVYVNSPNGFFGRQSLGCCSYENGKDFIENSGSYKDMVEEAFEDLLVNLRIRAETAANMLKATENELALLSQS